MSDDSKKESWWHTMPGLISAVAAVLTAITGLILALRDNAPPERATAAPSHVESATAVPTQTAPVRTAPTARDRPAPTVTAKVAPSMPQLGGLWRDNWGTVYRLTMVNANQFSYEAQGVACHGGNFRSAGQGEISGGSIRSNYQSSLPSQGSCAGSLDGGGSRMTVTCTDSACGTFVATSTRMQ